MPVKKTRTKRKKENKEPSESISVLIGINSSSIEVDVAISNKKATTNRKQKNTGNSGKIASSNDGNNKHIRSIKELSSILNSSSSSMNKLNSSKCFSNRKITDYFQIRKSSRKCKSDIEKERKQLVEEAIKEAREEGLEVRSIEGKGRAVFSTRLFKRGEFVCEYAGEMISYNLAKKREEMYAQDESIGCYMYFFEYKSKAYCIDATSESNRLGRLLNHSKLDGNCQAKLFETDARPHIILVASRDISAGEEMTYDYGDRNKNSIAVHPWLAT